MCIAFFLNKEIYNSNKKFNVKLLARLNRFTYMNEKNIEGQQITLTLNISTVDEISITTS